MSDSIPKVSIVIPHWNNVEILSECLKSIGSTIYPDFEVIVVDNASTDNSVQYVKANFPDVKLIENDRNDGYAGGCNIGADLAQGKYLVFLNNDTIQNPNWISSLLSTIKSNSQIAAVQPKILNYFDRKIFDYAGGSGGHMDVYCFPLARGRLFTHQENDEGQYDNKEKCFWSSGTCFMVKKNIFFEAGGFDSSFFAHMEEIDFCWRAFNRGYSIYYISSSKVYHEGAATIKINSSKTFLNYRNSLFMLTKNLPLKSLVSTLIIRLIMDILSSFRFLIRGETSNFLSIYKAHLDYYINVKKLLSNRNNNINKPNYFKINSIVYKYFILGKKKFFQL